MRLVIWSSKKKPRGESESVIELAELLKVQENGQFPDEFVKILNCLLLIDKSKTK